jgi:hypothetical protein
VGFSRVCASVSNRYVLVHSRRQNTQTYTHTHDVRVPASKTYEIIFILWSFKCLSLSLSHYFDFNLA